MDFENQNVCQTCQQRKSLSSFPKNKAKKNGHGAQCKECRKTYSKEWYKQNKEKVLDRQKKYYADNTETCKAARSRYAKDNAEKVRKYTREYQRKKKLPAPTRPCPDHCEMCLRPPGKHALHLDHCHVTGEFRGWLCGCCNTAFGRLGDSFELVIERLERYRSTVTKGKSTDGL